MATMQKKSAKSATKASTKKVTATKAPEKKTVAKKTAAKKTAAKAAAPQKAATPQKAAPEKKKATKMEQKKAVEIKKPVVLAADDDPEMLALVTRRVRRHDVTFHDAPDGQEAFETAKRVRPDLIILDVMMPGMSGWEVCRAIREEPTLAHTGIIMLTGIGERLNDMNSGLFGADEHLDKPFAWDALDEAMKRVLGKRGFAL